MVKEVPSPNASRSVSSVPGTMMWVGDRTLDEFFEIYRFCENRVAQMAVRSDLADAIRRPANTVRRIVVTRITRRPLDEPRFRELSRAYPAASILQLLGPLCDGETTGYDRSTDSQRIHWHQANQRLPAWLLACGGAEPQREPAVSSVAVVAATATIAEPLLDLAASAGVVAVWCRHPDPFRLRNVDSVWWDDSATPETDRDAWQQRMTILGQGSTERPRRHAWLVNAPNLEHCRTAREAGVEQILTKPGRIEPLLEMLGVVSGEPAAAVSEVSATSATVAPRTSPEAAFSD